MRDFCAREDGFITAFDSRHLAALKHSLPYESEVELLEFGRLAARFARLAGDDPKPLAGNAHFIGAIAEACESLEANSPFYGSRKYHGLHHRLAETIGNLAAWGFGSDTLGELAKESSDDLGPKLNSLSELWLAAEKRLADFGTELSYQHIARCLASEPDKDVDFPRCLVFLDGQLAPKHVAWLKWATDVGAEVTVVLESIPSMADLFELEQTAQREWVATLWARAPRSFGLSLPERLLKTLDSKSRSSWPQIPFPRSNGLLGGAWTQLRMGRFIASEFSSGTWRIMDR